MQALTLLFDRLIPWSPALSRFYFLNLWRLRDSRRTGPLVLVYQMGKVGSMSVKYSLKTFGQRLPNRPSIYHVHGLSPGFLEDRVSAAARLRSGGYRDAARSLLKRSWRSEHVRRAVERAGATKVHVVTLVRDPVARELAHFFQRTIATELVAGERWRLESPHMDFDVTVERERVAELGGLFLDRGCDMRGITFFDEEFRPQLDLDVYATAFDRERGWSVLETDRTKVLILRLEDLSREWTASVSDFLGWENCPLHRRNVGAEKSYAELYRLFLDEVGLPGELLDHLYESRHTRHFYTPAEIAGFRRRWRVA